MNNNKRKLHLKASDGNARCKQSSAIAASTASLFVRVAPLLATRSVMLIGKQSDQSE
jgi:hypothetical protein